MAAGTTLATVGLFWLTRLDTASGYAGEVLPTQIPRQCRRRPVLPRRPTWPCPALIHTTPGVASAALSTSQQIGAALGPALLNTLYVSAVTGYLTSRSESPGQTPRPCSWRPTSTATASRSSWRALSWPPPLSHYSPW